ncbi:MAG TPA: glutaminyl-peptide cyclotransferase [Sphingomonas sp.]
MRALVALLLAFVPVAARAIPVEPAQVVATFPHDSNAFTEGLFIRDGWLYESTGYAGEIRKEELATGKVVRRVKIPPGPFGEGIVDWKDQIVSLTWKGGRGFRWTLAGFRRLGEWHYDGEGWALTRDDRELIMSDGTPVLRFLDPVSLKVVRRLTVTAGGQPIAQLNELEYVKGEILANVWQTNAIARIDPHTGEVKGWIDVSALSRQAGAAAEAVPNGIAYDKATDRLFVTGKDWPLLFEIRRPEAK